MIIGLVISWSIYYYYLTHNKQNTSSNQPIRFSSCSALSLWMFCLSGLSSLLSPCSPSLYLLEAFLYWMLCLYSQNLPNLISKCFSARLWNCQLTQMALGGSPSSLNWAFGWYLAKMNHLFCQISISVRSFQVAAEGCCIFKLKNFFSSAYWDRTLLQSVTISWLFFLRPASS